MSFQSGGWLGHNVGKQIGVPHTSVLRVGLLTLLLILSLCFLLGLSLLRVLMSFQSAKSIGTNPPPPFS
jgi:hypothetical protein